MSKYRPPFFQTCCGEDDEPPSIRVPTSPKGSNHEDGPLATGIRAFISEIEFNQGINRFLPLPSDPMLLKGVHQIGHFQAIADLLRYYGKPEWGLRPRTYAILHMLGRTDLLDSFVAMKRTDNFLPYTDSNLPSIVVGAALRLRFLLIQKLVCGREDEELRQLEEGGQHLNLPGDKSDLFNQNAKLGAGATSEVHMVWSPRTLQWYARKKIPRGESPRLDEEKFEHLERELEALKKIHHRHVVRLVGSYTDERAAWLIMSPVAKWNLKEYLDERNLDQRDRKACLTTFFGCLATGLAYLHSKNIRHRDIKAKNVLVDDGQVYFTDFGLAHVWMGDGQGSTMDKTRKGTLRYYPPEIDDSIHNKAGDVWCLGCVFLEMATVMLGHDLKEMATFYDKTGSGISDRFFCNMEANSAWISKLQNEADDGYPVVLDWIKLMVQEDPQERPTAHQVRSMIIDAHQPPVFICHDCRGSQGLRSSSPERITHSPSFSTADGKDRSIEQDNDEPIKERRRPTIVTAAALGLPERPSPAKAASNAMPPGANSQPADLQLPIRALAGSQNPGNGAEHPSADPESLQSDIDQLPGPSDEFVTPEAVTSPKLHLEDCYPLPQGSLAPSYVLAEMNRLSEEDIMVYKDSPLFCNLFVYGRMMFPSLLKSIAEKSLRGAYSKSLRRRIFPTAGSWGKACYTTQSACAVMTPALLRGFDRWRPQGNHNYATIAETRHTARIMEQRSLLDLKQLSPAPPGEVRGMLIVGLREEVLSYCDILFASSGKSLDAMAPLDEEDSDGYDHYERPSMRREEVMVEIESDSGNTFQLQADTYVWSRSMENLIHPWREETFLRGSTLSRLLRHDITWEAEELAIATKLNMAFAMAGDYLCTPIQSGNVAELQLLLRRGYDPNTNCRIYGYPLQAAVVAGKGDMVSLLLQADADVDAVGGQYGTALIAAAYCNRMAILKMLLHKHADVFLQHETHVNALYQAVAHLHFSSVEVLLEHGAWLSPNWNEIRDKCEEMDNEDLSALLDKYDVRKRHKQYLLLEAEEEERRYVHSRDNGSARDRVQIERHAREQRKASLAVEKKNSTLSIASVVSLKFISLQAASGNWKGRRGVELTLAAVNAGASVDHVLGLLRNAYNPVQKLLDYLHDIDERREMERAKTIEDRMKLAPSREPGTSGGKGAARSREGGGSRDGNLRLGSGRRPRRRSTSPEHLSDRLGVPESRIPRGRSHSPRSSGSFCGHGGRP